MKKIILRTLIVVFAMQFSKTVCFGQIQSTKHQTMQKQKGIFTGFYIGSDGNYQISFENNKYSARFTLSNGEVINLNNLVADEIKKTIMFNKAKEPKITTGELTSKGLKIEGKYYTDETSAD